MKHVLQDKKTGQIVVADLPVPARTEGALLVRVHASVISAGTEGAMVAATGRTLLQRVADKPDLIRKGLQTLKTRGLDGLRSQIEGKYSGYEALGYSCAGEVMESDPTASGIRPGQHVACGGIGYANHAEVVAVPHRLCAIVPDNVDSETAAYATLGAIAMQGFRQSGATLGENVAVIGLGLVGLLAAQLLRAAGCRVIGIDPSASARRRGMACGCIAAVDNAQANESTLEATRGLGADAVLICAATSSSDPVALAGEIARSRGRVVMVGATGMEIPREQYYRKELSFLLSRSYGPGRYDPTYEEAGIDYPADFVRFTEQRNLQSFLDLAAAGAISVKDITTHRFGIDDAANAYALLSDRTIERVGIVLQYPHEKPLAAVAPPARPHGVTGRNGIGFIGAGGYAEAVLLPELKHHDGVVLRGVCTRQPARAASAMARFGFAFTASDAEGVLADTETGTLFITTRHDSHADYALAALKARKHVWVEKPLALSLDQLHALRREHASSGVHLAVGFNRRFSPLSGMLRATIAPGSPVMIAYRVNAGHLPPEHWTQDAATGGGRLLGEGCHFLDYLCFLANAKPLTVNTAGLCSDRKDLPAASNFAVTVTFDNGSVGQLLYAAEGASSLPKERIEVFSGGTAAVLDDFVSLVLHTKRGERTERLRQQDKGQRAMITAFIAATQGRGEFPLSADAVLTSTLLTLAAQESLITGKPVDLAAFDSNP